MAVFSNSLFHHILLNHQTGELPATTLARALAKPVLEPDVNAQCNPTRSHIAADNRVVIFKVLRAQ